VVALKGSERVWRDFISVFGKKAFGWEQIGGVAVVARITIDGGGNKPDNHALGRERVVNG
jgi:hypothetical protein